MLLHFIKQAVRVALPGVVQKRHARRQRAAFKEAYFDRQTVNAKRFYGSGQPKILLGPFAGLSYLNEVVWGPIEPKWIGHYEAELHHIFESMPTDAYDVIVDVGSAEGYYSVSLAKKFPEATVTSYDTDPWAREQQARLAGLNGCKNINIGRYCSPGQLESDLKEAKRGLVICDIEGFEYELLDPNVVLSLVRADILIEIHFSLDDRKLSVDDGCRELIQRFSKSHSAEIIGVKKRDLDFIRSQIADGSISQSDIAEAIDEHRPDFQKWVWLQSRHGDTQ